MRQYVGYPKRDHNFDNQPYMRWAGGETAGCQDSVGLRVSKTNTLQVQLPTDASSFTLS